MSHSHIPVRHLIRQIEIRGRRPRRKGRPEWLTQLVDRAADLFEPLEDVARVGFECRPDENRWHVELYLGSTELIGGAEDGDRRHAAFEFDLLRLAALFEKVDRFAWGALPDDAGADDSPNVSLVTIEGACHGNLVRLQVRSMPPPHAAPGLRQFPDGRCDPA